MVWITKDFIFSTLFIDAFTSFRDLPVYQAPPFREELSCGARPSHIAEEDYPPSNHSSQNEDSEEEETNLQTEPQENWMSSPNGLTPEQLRLRRDDQLPIADRIGGLQIDMHLREPLIETVVPTQEEGAMTNRSDWSQASDRSIVLNES